MLVEGTHAVVPAAASHRQRCLFFGHEAVCLNSGDGSSGARSELLSSTGSSSTGSSSSGGSLAETCSRGDTRYNYLDRAGMP